MGTQNRAAQLSLARRGQRQRWTGHRTYRMRKTHTRAMEKSKNGTHPPFDGDAPRDPIFGQRGGPTATFWPNPSTVHGYNAGTGLVDIPYPSGGGATSLTYQTGSRLAQSTTQWTAKSSPSWTATLIKLEWAKSSARGILQTISENVIGGETSRGDIEHERRL